MRPRSLMALLVAGACSGQIQELGPAPPSADEGVSVHTAINQSLPFDRYRTFSFGPTGAPPVGYEDSTRYAEIQRRIRSLIGEALMQKGYTPAIGEGDFVVMFAAGHHYALPPASTSITGDWLPDDANADLVDGALVIDVFDAALGTQVWHGASETKLNPDRIDDPLVQRVVKALLAPFPAAMRHVARGP